MSEATNESTFETCMRCGGEVGVVIERTSGRWGPDGPLVSFEDRRSRCQSCGEEWYNMGQSQRHTMALLQATVAALTAENAQLRETLTLGLGEQESVIAGLRAENERMRSALANLLAVAPPEGIMTDEPMVQPALTPEEWAVKTLWLHGVDSGPSVAVTDHGVVEIDNDDYYTRWHATLTSRAHGVAALCLYGKPYGFTHADLDMLDAVADELQGRATELDVRAFRDRIAALLPPRSADPLKSPPGY